MLAQEPALKEALGGGLQLPHPHRCFGVIFGKTPRRDGGDLRLWQGREAPRQRRAVCLAKPCWLFSNAHVDHPPGPKFLGHGKQPVALHCGGMLASPSVPSQRHEMGMVRRDGDGRRG